MLFIQTVDHVAIPSGKLKSIVDSRLPNQRLRWICSMYSYPTFQDVLPLNKVSIFPSGYPEPIRFFITSPENCLCDISNSYISYKIRIKKADGTILTRDDANTGTYCSLTTASDSSLLSSYSAATSSCSMIYMKNSMSPIHTI